MSRDINIPLSAGAALFLLFAPALVARSGPVPLASVRIEPGEVIRGGEAVLTVSVSWEGAADDLAISRPEPPALRGLTLAGSSQRSVSLLDRGRTRQVREFVFNIRGDEEGTGRIGPVRLVYRRRGEEEEYSLSTEPLEVPVVSRAAAAPLPLPALFGLALLGASLAVLYSLWWVRRYKKKSNELIADYVENLESKALRDLEATRKARLEGDLERYCRGIREVLLDYRRGKASPARPEGPEKEDDELSLLLRLEEFQFGSSRDAGELDEIYRRFEILLRSRERQTNPE